MEQRPRMQNPTSWRKVIDAFDALSDRLYRGTKRLASALPAGILTGANAVGVRLGMGIGTLLGSLLILGALFSLQARFTSDSIQRLVALQDPKADAAYKMKITLMDTNLAVLSYLQDREERYLTRIDNGQREFNESYKLYMKMTQTPEEIAVGGKLGGDQAAWAREISRLVLLRDEQFEKTRRFLKGLDKMAGILNPAGWLNRPPGSQQ